MRLTIVWVILMSLIFTVPAAAQYRPEYLLWKADTLIARATTARSDADVLIAWADSIAGVADSLKTLLSQPEPRTLTSASELFNTVDLLGAGSLTYPLAGVDVTGARGAVVTITFATFTGGMTIYDAYSTTQTDTSATAYLGTTLAGIDVNAADVKSKTIIHYLQPPHGMDFLMGYYHMRMTGDGSGSCNLQDAIATIKVLY